MFSCGGESNRRLGARLKAPNFVPDVVEIEVVVVGVVVVEVVVGVVVELD